MKPLQEQTLYEILEVPIDAPEAEIVKAWDRVNALYGPGALATYTLMGPGEAEMLGRRLDEAISILLDPDERKRYDARITGTPAPLPGRGENGTGQQRSAPAPEPRRLPPIIPPLARVPAASLAVAEPIPAPAPTSNEVLSTEALTLAAGPAEALEPAGLPAAAPAPIPTEAPVPAPVLAILLSFPVAPIPLATPVPISPPFAALAEAKPVAAPLPAPAGPAAVSRFPQAQELVVPEGTRFSGDVLRRAREARGLSVAQVCERTKIMRHHIENLESDRYEKLPVPVYVRGILMALAKELRLDGQKVARSYLDAMQAGLAHPAKR